MSNTRNYGPLLKAAKAEELLAIIPGMAAEEPGFHFSQEQVDNMADALEAAEQATANAEAQAATITEHVATIATLNDANAGLQQQLATANESIQAKDQEITALQAKVAELGGKPAGVTAVEEPGDDEFEEQGTKANDFPFQKELYGMLGR